MSTQNSWVLWTRSDWNALHTLLKKHKILFWRSFVVNVFIFVLIPTVLVFLIGIARLGLSGSSIGIGDPHPLSLSLGQFVNSSSPLLWSAEGSLLFNASQVIASLGLTSTLRVSNSSVLSDICKIRVPGSSSPCFAGVSFFDAYATETSRNYTLMYPSSSVPYGLNIATDGLARLGILQLQLALDRALVMQAFPGLTPQISAAGVSLQVFTSITQADFNTQYYGFFYSFIATTGAAVFVAVFMFPVFWLSQSLAVETEGRLKEAMAIMSLRASVYHASNVIVYTLASVIGWLLISAIFAFLVFSSDYPSLLALVSLAGLGLMGFTMLAAQFIRRARTAGLVTILVAFALAMVGLAASKASPNATLRCILASTISPSGFVLGVVMLARAEEAAVPVSVGSWFSNVEASQGISFGALLACMAANVIVNLSAAWYAAQTVPGQFGVPKPWYFVCMRLQTCCKKHGANVARATRSSVATPMLVDADVVIDATLLSSSSVLEIEAEERPAVQIRHLTKLFNEGRSLGRHGSVAAVSNLNLDLRPGEVCVLVGRNGCGKTTTINMLVGMLTPTSGDAFVCGHAITSNMDSVRRNVGLCPQHDVLWPDLTVLQTLEVYAGIKGVPAAAVHDEAQSWVTAVGLGEKGGSEVSTLSGGQKRRVSIAAAFIGGSRIIFLDEPTAGLDPHSRRDIWAIINAHKKGRVILLTTHFLDEAEILGNTIAVMASGRLRGLGSPLFLKTRFGFGYTITALLESSVTSPEAAAATIQSCVAAHVPTAHITGVVGREVSLGLPIEANASFPALLHELEARSSELGIASLGVSCASLQDVFMRLVGADASGTLDGHHGAAVPFPPHGSDASAGVFSGTSDLHVMVKGSDWTQPSAAADALPLKPSSLQRLKVLLHKRALVSLRDWRMVLAPLLLVVAAAAAVGSGFKSQQPVTCPPSQFFVSPAQQVTPILGQPPYGTGQLFAVSPTLANFSGMLASDGILPLQSATAVHSTLTSQATSLWGGFAASDAITVWPDATIISNLNKPLSAAVAASSATNALIAESSPSTGQGPWIVASLQPFPEAVQPFSGRDWTPAFIIIGIVVATCALATPLSSTMAVARENAIGAKMQQRLAGVTAAEYWGAHLLWDTIPAIVFALALAGGASGLPAWLLPFSWTALLFFLQGLAAVLLGYIATFVVTPPAGVFAATVGYQFLLTVGVVTAVFTQLGQDNGKAIIEYVTYAAFAVCPLSSVFMGVMYAMNIGFVDCAAASQLQLDGGIISYALIGRPLVFLTGQLVVLWAILMILEHKQSIELWLRAIAAVPLSKLSGSPDSMAALSSRARAAGVAAESACANTRGSFSSEESVDPDIRAEKIRVNALLATATRGLPGGRAIPASSVNISAGDMSIVPDAVLAVNLRREFPSAGKVALHNLSLGIASHETFGLLGTNGAGKTTMLRLVAGQDVPTSGDVIVSGHSLLHDLSGVQSCVGVCPQFDVLYAELSAIEHLRLYAALRGLQGAALNAEVAWLVEHLDLSLFAHKPAGVLSGGNRRKLSVAIALVRSPKVLVLDEPSTGMDPAAKRFLWRVITDLQKRSASTTTIITTHSMEECEAVSQRIGILVAGRLAALGGPQHLKTKHGADFQVDAVCATEADAKSFILGLSEAFPGRVRLLEQQSGHVRVAVSRQGIGAPVLTAIFAAVEAARETVHITAYQVSQTSLEQIFLDLAGTQDSSGISIANEEREAFGARALLLHLIAAPIVFLCRWALLVALLFCAVFFVVIPPLCALCLRAVRAHVQWRARVDMQLLESLASGPSARIRRSPSTPIFVPDHEGDQGRGFCATVACGQWEYGGAVLTSGTSGAGAALFFLALVQPCIVILLMLASAGALCLGVGTLFGFGWSMLLQRRLALWHKKKSGLYLCTAPVN